MLSIADELLVSRVHLLQKKPTNRESFGRNRFKRLVKYNVEKDHVALNLQISQEGLLECWGRLQGDYPVCLPDNCLFTCQVVEDPTFRHCKREVG